MGFIRSGVVVRSLWVAVAAALGTVGCGTALDSSGLGGPGGSFPDAGSVDVGAIDAPLDIAPDGLGDRLPDAGSDVATSEVADAPIDVASIDSTSLDADIGLDAPATDAPVDAVPDVGPGWCKDAPPTGSTSYACIACGEAACPSQYAAFTSVCATVNACYSTCECSDSTCQDACGAESTTQCDDALSMWSTCLRTPCASACGGGAPVDAATDAVAVDEGHDALSDGSTDAGADSMPDGSLVELGKACIPGDVCAEGTCVFGYCANKCDFTSDPVCPMELSCTGSPSAGYWCIP